MPPHKRRRIARETMDIYAPIANRLGIFKMRHELLDLSIKAAYPMRYRALESACKEVVGYRKEIFNTIEAAIRPAPERDQHRGRGQVPAKEHPQHLPQDEGEEAQLQGTHRRLRRAHH